MLSHNIQLANSVTIGFKNTVNAATASMVAYGVAIAGAIAAVYLIVKAIDALIVTYDEQKEKTKELAEEFEEASRDVDEVNQKINNNKKLIEEINSKPLDIVDKNTLEVLTNENAQLRIQKELLEDIANQKKKELAKST